MWAGTPEDGEAGRGDKSSRQEVAGERGRQTCPLLNLCLSALGRRLASSDCRELQSFFYFARPAGLHRGECAHPSFGRLVAEGRPQSLSKDSCQAHRLWPVALGTWGPELALLPAGLVMFSSDISRRSLLKGGGRV